MTKYCTLYVNPVTGKIWLPKLCCLIMITQWENPGVWSTKLPKQTKLYTLKIIILDRNIHVFIKSSLIISMYIQNAGNYLACLYLAVHRKNISMLLSRTVSQLWLLVIWYQKHKIIKLSHFLLLLLSHGVNG